MKTLQLRTFFILLTVSLSTTTAWSSQNVPATSATESQAIVPEGATAESGKNSSAANEGLPGILNEEEIPAFLRTDPCDTGDS